MNTFSDYMRDLRQKLKISLKDTAASADLSVTYIWQIEKGKKKPSAEALKRLARVYNANLNEVLERAGYLEKPEATASELERLKHAFKLVETDPDYTFGTRLGEKELTPEVMRYIVRLYEQTTGKRLL